MLAGISLTGHPFKIYVFQAKCRNAEEYARSIVNGGAKWLLVTLRLAKEYRTLRTLEDIPFKFFVSGLQAYSHAHMEVC